MAATVNIADSDVRLRWTVNRVIRKGITVAEEEKTDETSAQTPADQQRSSSGSK